MIITVTFWRTQSTRTMPKNVLILSRPLSNILDEGSKNLVYYIAKHSNSGLRILVENDFSLHLPNNIQQVRIKGRINKDYVENSRSMYIKLRLALEVIKIFKYEAIHSFFTITTTTAIILLFASIVLRKKIIINLPVFCDSRPVSPAIKLLLKRAAWVFVMTNYTKNKILKHTKNASIVLPVVDPKRYRPINNQEKSFFRKKLNLDSFSKIIIIPGEYGRLEMTDNLMSIVKQIGHKQPEALFVFSFRLKTKHDLQAENTTKKTLEGYNVLYLNTVNNYFEYVAASDFALFPAKNMLGKFDLPLALVEIMAMGKPVLHTDIAPLNELYNAKDGFCLPDNPDIFANKIVENINNNELYKNLSNTTLREAQRFMPENVIPDYESLYDSVIK